MSQGIRRPLGIVLLHACVACSGSVSNSQLKETPGTSGGGKGGLDNPGFVVEDEQCAETAPTAADFNAGLLSPSQYGNTVYDLLKVRGEFSKGWTGGASDKLDELGVERRANAAADIAQKAAMQLAAWSPCTPASLTNDACKEEIIKRVGGRAFRHPLNQVEQSQLRGLFDAGIADGGFQNGVEWFLSGLLQSPDFLYQFARVSPDDTKSDVVALSPFELASRLSYFLWDSTPDDDLLQAASKDEIGSDAQLTSTLERMAADPKFNQGVEAFFTRWLKLDAFRELARDDKTFTTDVANALQKSLLLGATRLYADGARPSLESLYSGQEYYLDGTLRKFYGMSAAGTDFSAAKFNGEPRQGILTHPALLSLLARPSHSDPISRGLFVLRNVMCQDIPSPPPGLPIPPLPAAANGLSTRERLAKHTSVPQCAACHSLIDPPGLALESFDEVGRYRTMDAGKPVDSSGTIKDAGDLSGPFASGEDLLKKVAVSEEARRCFADHYYSFAFSRAQTDNSECAAEGIKKSFEANADLRKLPLMIAASTAFRFRNAGGSSK